MRPEDGARKGTGCGRFTLNSKNELIETALGRAHPPPPQKATTPTPFPFFFSVPPSYSQRLHSLGRWSVVAG